MDESTSSPVYRRGLVLGLTLAEIFLLLLFLLLLLSIFLIDEERRTNSRILAVLSQGRSLSQDELVENAKEMMQIRAAIEAAGIPIDDPNELKSRLVSAKSAEELLAPYKKKCGNLAEVDKLVARLQRPDLSAEEALRLCASAIGQLTSAEKVASIDEARIIIDRLRRQIISTSTQLESLSGGKGLVYPSCWTPADNPNGQVFIYNVTVLDAGLRVGMGDSRDGQDLTALKLNGPEPDFGRTLPVEEFLDRTRGLYDWSIREKCRFFVRLADGTSPTNKAGYKLMRATVERHFYIRITD